MALLLLRSNDIETLTPFAHRLGGFCRAQTALGLLLVDKP